MTFTTLPEEREDYGALKWDVHSQLFKVWWDDFYTLTISGDFIKGDIVFLWHVTKKGEDDKAREEAGQRIYGAGDDSISEKNKNSFENWKHTSE